jgi:hypothetical protein
LTQQGRFVADVKGKAMVSLALGALLPEIIFSVGVTFLPGS